MTSENKKPLVAFSFERIAAEASVITAVESMKKEEDREEPFRGVVLEDRMSDFEKAQFLRYKLRELEVSLSTKNTFDLNYTKSKIVRRFYEFDFENCGLTYRGPNVRDVEKQIDKLPFVHECSNFGGNGALLSWDTIFENKEISGLIDNYIEELLQYFRTAIHQIETKKGVKKEYYSRNLELYMNLIGMTDPKEIAVTKYLYLQSVNGFFLGLRDNFSKSNIFRLCDVTDKDWQKMIISDTFNIMVGSTCGRDNKKHIVPRQDVLRLIYGFEGYDQNFLDAIINKVPATELTLEDFGHIRQRNYIKSILSNALKNKTKGVNILIYGKAGTGKTEFAKTLIQEVGAEGYMVADNEKKNIYQEDSIYDRPRIPMTELDIRQNYVRNGVFRTLALCLKKSPNSVIFYDEAEDYFRKNEVADQSKQNINNTLENNETPTIWTCNELNAGWIEKSFIRRFTYTIELDQINNTTLIDLTRKIGAKNGVKLNTKVEELICQEQPSVGLIEKCVKAYKLSGSKDMENLYEGLKDLIYAERYANKKPRDIVKKQAAEYNQNLANTDIKLDKITNGIIKSGKNDWSLILYGVSGTGKTAYAEFLGKKLGMKVIKKKVADLQSMWVGECEHNIDQAFEEARSENAILLFDEGDCWLRDRRFNRASWETSQTNQFLQNLEAATTPVIVTTNLMDSLDQAALRRFVFKVGFKYMTKSQVKEAFKTFYNINVTDEEANISYVTPGDFAVIGKQLDYLDEKPTAAKIKELLLEEIKNKKDDFKENSIRV